MTALTWSRSGESVRAHRSPRGSDTLNRALKQVLAESGYDLGADHEDAFRGLLGPVFNVRSNGVTGASLNDVSDEINVLQEEANDAGGGIVYLPNGTYYASDLIGYAGVHLIGQSWKNTRLVDSSGSTYLYSVNPGSGGTSDPDDNATAIVIANLTLQGLVDTLGFSEHVHLLNINAVSDVLLENVKFIGPRGDAVYVGSSNTAATERHNERVTIRKCHFDGVNKDNRNAISIIDGSDILIDDVYVTRFTRSTMPGAIDIEPDTNAFARCQHITIRKVHCNDIGGNIGAVSVFVPTSQASLTTPVRHIVIDDVVVNGCALGYGVIAQQDQTVADTTADHNLHISNVHARNCLRPFGFFGLKAVKLSDSSFEDCERGALIGFTGANQNNRDIILDNVRLTRNGTVDGIGIGVYTVDGLTLRDVHLVDCGLENGSFGQPLNFVSGTSTRVTFDNVTIEDTGVSVVTAAVQVEAGHTLTTNTNYQRGTRLLGCTGNNFTPAEIPGNRTWIGGWFQEDVAANQASTELARADGRHPIGRAGSITGCVLKSSEARTAGTATVHIMKNTGLAGAAGASIGFGAELNGTNTTFHATSQDPGTDTVAEGDEIYTIVVTSADWLPETADFWVSIEYAAGV